MSERIGFPPTEVAAVRRVEGLAVFVTSVAAFQVTGGHWWLFLVLILAPDLAMLVTLAGQRIRAWSYNLAHTYSVPLVLGGLGWFAGVAWLLPVALIWVAHIGADRALGYGLKYPALDHATHLGWIGKARSAAKLADAG